MPYKARTCPCVLCVVNMKKARYYPALKRLTYWIGDKIQHTRSDIVTEVQARVIIYDLGDGPREIVQKLEVVTMDKI